MHNSSPVVIDEPVRQHAGGGGPVGYPPEGFGRGPDPRPHRASNQKYRIGAWLAITAIVMMFVSITSMLVVRKATANDYGHTALPLIVYFNTAVLFASSITLERSRRAMRKLTNGGFGVSSFTAPLYVTFALGLLFVAGQLLAWHTLAGRGVYLATNPSSSSFYLLTGLHGLHLLGGVAILLYLVLRMARMSAARLRASMGAAALYWHFMGALWAYILFLFAVRL